MIACRGCGRTGTGTRWRRRAAPPGWPDEHVGRVETGQSRLYDPDGRCGDRTEDPWTAGNLGIGASGTQRPPTSRRLSDIGHRGQIAEVIVLQAEDETRAA